MDAFLRVQVCNFISSGTALHAHDYRDPFDPLDLANCVAGNDDFNGILASRLTDVVIAPGQVLVVVASTLANNANIGGFTIAVLTQAAP